MFVPVTFNTKQQYLAVNENKDFFFEVFFSNLIVIASLQCVVYYSNQILLTKHQLPTPYSPIIIILKQTQHKKKNYFK